MKWTSIDAFLRAIGEGRTRVCGEASSPKHLAHTIYSVMYQFYNSKFSLDRFKKQDAVVKFVDRVLIPPRTTEEEPAQDAPFGTGSWKSDVGLQAAPRTMHALLKKEARKIILNDAEMLGLICSGEMAAEETAEIWFRFVDRISEKVLRQSADRILESVSGANLFDIFHTIGSVGSLYTLLVPYFISYTPSQRTAWTPRPGEIASRAGEGRARRRV